MTNFTLDQAIADAKIMDAKAFDTKYYACTEWLDMDNIGDPNDGVFNVNFRGKDGSINLLFVDGKYEA